VTYHEFSTWHSALDEPPRPYPGGTNRTGLDCRPRVPLWEIPPRERRFILALLVLPIAVNALSEDKEN
jgi:hypothetical protein